MSFITSEVEKKIDTKDLPQEVDILPVKNAVLFPGVVFPITVNRQKSIKLIKKVNKGNRIIGIITQKNQQVEEPQSSDLYLTGTLAYILKTLVMPDGSTTIIIQGKNRFHIEKIIQEEPWITAEVKYLTEKFPPSSKKETKVLFQSIKEASFKILKLNPEIPREAHIAISNIHSNSFLTHFLCSNVNADLSERQKLLETEDGGERAELLLQYMMRDIQMLTIKQDIQNKAFTDIDQQQKDYFLRQQMKVLQNELGFDGPEKDIEKIKTKASKKQWSKETQEHFQKEFDKLSRINSNSPEFALSLNYVEFFVNLPWNEYTNDDFDIKNAESVLDTDHYGMKKVKKRIIEYLAVLKLKGDMKSPIMCLYGPPGVGKTSLGKSVARALKRNYVRLSLGALHDEAEIRGHRKTYIGAMPGKIISHISKAKSSNPVFILDEIDKVNRDHRGDPSHALLEVLDPEQNNNFLDNYLEVGYDLSKVLFIATANNLDSIQAPLRDRMEIIELSGYTVEEKIEIAKKHIIPKQKKEHGLKANEVIFSTESIRKIIENYTKESGVRGLERNIASVIRNRASCIAKKEIFSKNIKLTDIPQILGSEIYDREEYQVNDIAGIVTGLAWTPYGGEILQIESSLYRGTGKITLSGQLGDVMKESAMAAMSFLKSYAEALSIHYKIFNEYDVHVHVPAGAVPKDGPSAGITLVTSLASAFTQRKIKERIAMTGEITLSGKVLPVGGIKEKLLASKRAGIQEVILSSKNKKDIDEIDELYKKGLKINYINHISEVLKIALLEEKVKNPIRIYTLSETPNTITPQDSQ